MWRKVCNVVWIVRVAPSRASTARALIDTGKPYVAADVALRATFSRYVTVILLIIIIITIIFFFSEKNICPILSKMLFAVVFARLVHRLSDVLTT